jgi:hypothetical protein
VLYLPSNNVPWFILRIARIHWYRLHQSLIFAPIFQKIYFCFFKNNKFDVIQRVCHEFSLFYLLRSSYNQHTLFHLSLRIPLKMYYTHLYKCVNIHIYFLNNLYTYKHYVYNTLFLLHSILNNIYFYSLFTL